MIECFGLLEMKLKLNLLFCYFQCRYTLLVSLLKILKNLIESLLFDIFTVDLYFKLICTGINNIGNLSRISS